MGNDHVPSSSREALSDHRVRPRRPRRIPRANRLVMAPMTRSRATVAAGEPTGSMAAYYTQRASAGLIVTEGIQPSPVGQGYPDTPGLHTAEQVAGVAQGDRRRARCGRAGSSRS